MRPESEWDSDLVLPWDDEAVSAEANAQLASASTDWRIEWKDIEICKHPDGSDWLLGPGTRGQVRAWCPRPCSLNPAP